MHAWTFLLLFAAQQLSLSSSHYHVLVAHDRQQAPVDLSVNSLFSHLRHRRSLAPPEEILSSLSDYEGSGGDGSDGETGDIQTFQFFMKNNATLHSARTTISEMMPSDAVLMDFSIHNEGKTYRFNREQTKSIEEASVEFQDAVSSGFSTIMLGDVKTSLQRCSDCRADESDPSEAVAAVINVAPGDILSVSLSYMVPKTIGRIVENEKEMYRTDTTLDLDESANNFTAVIMSPNYPADYPSSSDLTWLINAPSNDMVISSKFISFSTEACCDHLYIYDGPTDTYPLIYVISGEVSSQKTIMTTKSSMFVKFQTDSLVTAGGFAMEIHPTSRDFLEEIQYDEDKAGQINDTLIFFDSFGVIKTPDYPEFYPASSTFVWDIMVESAYTIDFQVRDFDVSPGETLQIIDMNTREVYVTLESDTSVPYNFNVSSNELSLLFQSKDKLIPKRGLYCKYFSRRVEELNLIATDSGEWQTISSPHYPHHYSSNEYLVWTVTVDDPSYRVRMEVVSLNLERGYDFLVLYTGTSIDYKKRLGILSGVDAKDIEFVTRENSATIVFQTDRSITDTGFQLRFRSFVVNTNCSTATDVIQGQASGAVENLDYTDYTYYTHNCQWLIVVKETKIITIFLERFYGSYAQITFYDGDSKDDPVLWSSNGDTSISREEGISPKSSSNQMLVVISRTNSYNTKFGFRFQEIDLENYPVCSPEAVYTVAPGQITSPKYPLYSPYMDCTWLIQAPTDYQVLVTIKVYDVYYKNVINFYSGNSTSDPLITNCAHCTSGYWIRSGDSMLIEASISVSDARFKFEYEFVSGATTLINRDVGFAISPSYPSAYPDQSYEVTYIKVTSGAIKFYFDVFQTEECCDFLNLYDGGSTSSPIIASLRGGHQGFEGQTSGRYLTLEFSSDDYTTDGGFKMEYCSTTEDCKYLGKRHSAYSYQQLVTNFYGHISSPSASGYYPALSDFQWYIECPSITTQIRYYFERIDIDYTDSITLYNDFTMSEDNVAMRYSNGINYYYTGRDVQGVAPRNVLSFHSDTTFSGMGFYLSYICDG